jgi:hypothetical protein
MITARRLWFVFLAILLSFSGRRAWAKTQVISFKDALAQSESIAIVKFVEFPKANPARGKNRPSQVKLEVLRVLKGSLRVGEQDVNFEDVPRREPGEFVAFLDRGRAWRFVAVPLAGDKVNSEVLLISGCYEFGAEYVTPGLITLAQLMGYLKEGTLHYSFGGPIWFPQNGKKSWKPSSLRINGTYDAVNNSARVTGLGKLAGFPVEPIVSVDYRGDKGGQVHLVYSRRGDRPLEITGLVEGLDVKTGAINARFAVVAPDVLTQARLEKYLADSRLGHCYYSFRLRCAATKEYPQLRDLSLTLEKESGTIGYLEGWGRESLEIGASSFHGPMQSTVSVGGKVPAPVDNAPDWVLRMQIPARTGQELVLDFEIGKPSDNKDIVRWMFQSELLYRVYSGSLRGTLHLFDGKKLRTVTTFSVEIASVEFGRIYDK